jgi:hypothetical protein
MAVVVVVACLTTERVQCQRLLKNTKEQKVKVLLSIPAKDQ